MAVLELFRSGTILEVLGFFVVNNLHFLWEILQSILIYLFVLLISLISYSNSASGNSVAPCICIEKIFIKSSYETTIPYVRASPSAVRLVER